MPLIAKVGRKKWKVKFLFIGITIFLWLGVVIHLFPVWWIFSSSLKGNVEIFAFPPTFFPHTPYWGVYKLLIKGASKLLPYPLWIYIKNSVILVVGVILLQVPLSAIIAYTLSKLHRPRWSRILFLFFVGTMFVPSEVSLIPSYLILQNFPFPSRSIPNIPFTNTTFPHINFLNTYWAVILPSMVNAFNVLLFKGYFDTIPNEIINAARLDGSSEIGILRRIILPMSKPIFAVVGYFTFTGIWGSFLWPLIVLNKPDLWPISVTIYKAQETIARLGISARPSSGEIEEIGFLGWNGIMALSVMESIPVIIGFLIFREYLMKGIKLRGFK